MKVGMIGCGVISRQYLESFDRLPDVQLVAVADLDRARALMRKLGAIVIHTENRAVEETAQEILRYYERAHPQGADIVIRS